MSRPPIHVDTIIVNASGEVVAFPGKRGGPSHLRELFEGDELDELRALMLAGDEQELVFDDELRVRVRVLVGLESSPEPLFLLELRHSSYFFSKLCHNIRTPLSTIMNLAECGLLHQDVANIHDLVERIPNLVVGTSEMLEALQSYIDPPPLRRRNETVSALCERANRQLVAGGGRVHLQSGGEHEVFCDVEVMGRAVGLVASYVKQSSRENPVLGAEEQADGRGVRVMVRSASASGSLQASDEVYFEGFARRVKGSAGLDLLTAARLAALSGSGLRLYQAEGGSVFSILIAGRRD